MKRIPLAQDKFALVDDIDYKRVSQYHWRWKRKGGDIYYAYRRKESKGRRTSISMHRFILRLSSNEKRLVDHRNFNGLDNRKVNLRLATTQENCRHSRKHRDCTHSRYKGVYWEQGRKQWRAYIYLNKKKIWLGRFVDEKEAARAYNKKAKEMFGEYALLNNIVFNKMGPPRGVPYMRVRGSAGIE